MAQRADDDVPLFDRRHATTGQLELVVTTLVVQHFRRNQHTFFARDVCGDTQFVTEPKSGSGDFADVAMDVTEPGDTQSVTEPEPESDKDEPDKDEPAVSYAYLLVVTLTINYA